MFEEQKTGATTKIKLPAYALTIIEKFIARAHGKKYILPLISQSRFNINLKRLAERAAWTQPVDKTRSKRGRQLKVNIQNGKKEPRFCDLKISHVTRRTAVSTMLMLGMPEHAVKKISGHTGNSKAFYRYVNLVQSHMDTHIDKVFEQLEI